MACREREVKGKLNMLYRERISDAISHRHQFPLLLLPCAIARFSFTRHNSKGRSRFFSAIFNSIMLRNKIIIDILNK